MDFAEFYSERYSVAPKIFDGNPRSDTGIIVVIPCYDDEFIFTTLQSLDSAKVPSCSVEVIVVVNSAENTEEAIVEKNRRIYATLCEKKDSYQNFSLLPYIIEGVPHKIAGVGNARKIGMDEAVWRFASVENSRGVIVSLDADCLVSEDYFIEIYSRFYCSKDKPNACTLQYRHNFDEKMYSEQEISACRKYENVFAVFPFGTESCWYSCLYAYHWFMSCRYRRGIRQDGWDVATSGRGGLLFFAEVGAAVASCYNM